MAKKTRKSKRNGFSTWLMLVFNFIALLLLLLSYLASFISPAVFWPMVLFGLAYPVILLINTFFVVYWLLRLRWWALMSLAGILIGYNHVNGVVKFFGRDEHPERYLKVMSFNARYFDRFQFINNKNIETRNRIFQMIREENPDIICFQEFSSDKTPYFNIVDTLAKNYGYKHYHTVYSLVRKGDQSYGNAVFSKHPIINKDIYRFTNNHRIYAIINDIVVKQDTFRVFNVHFESLQLSWEDRMFMKELAIQNETQEELVTRSRQISGKVRHASVLRSLQVQETRALIEKSPYPVILCTDLNDTPSSYAYRQLTRKLKDSFVESGKGVGRTYNEFVPAFRIDYIFYDPFFESHGHRTIFERLSDHYPIVTYLAY